MGINTMTIDNLKIFSKIEAQDNLASTLTLKYNRDTENIHLTKEQCWRFLIYTVLPA